MTKFFFKFKKTILAYFWPISLIFWGKKSFPQKLIVPQERSDGINWSFACWYNFTQIKRWLKLFGVSMAKNGCGQSGDRTLKLTVSDEWADGINWFFPCWYTITKNKSWSNFLWVGICQKLVLPVWSWDSKIHCISKMNRWNKVIFFMLVRIQQS